MAHTESPDLEWLAGVFKALAHPHRLHIFLRLAANCCPPSMPVTAEGQLNVGALGEDLELAPSTVSHHIKELRQAGVVRVARDGQTIRCWVDPEVIQVIARFVHQAACGQPCCVVRRRHRP